MSARFASASASILWRRLDRGGHESARVTNQNGLWQVRGSAVFADAGLPVRLDYSVECDPEWQTRSALVAGWVGTAEVDVRVGATPNGWRLNGQVATSVAGCIDVDLNFSPSTNLLPIRRLNLAVGEEATVRAAWLRFPSFQLEPLEQRYRRIDLDTYAYESAGGSFRAELRVNGIGLPLEYAGLWVSEASA